MDKKEKHDSRIIDILIDYASSCLMKIMPILQTASIALALKTVLGPKIFNIFTDDDGIIRLLTIIHGTGFFFLPVFLGYSSAKKLQLPSLYGILLGTILISPDLISIAQAQEGTYLLGLMLPKIEYAQTVFPVMMCMPLVKILYDLCEKKLPDIVSNSFGSTIVFFICIPLCLLFIAPIGSALTRLFSSFLAWSSANLGVFSGAIIGGLWYMICMTGTHIVIMPTLVSSIMTTGQETLVLPYLTKAFMALLGIELAALLRIKDKTERGNIISYCISDWVGGISDPAFYGLCMKYKGAMPVLVLAGGIGGLLANIFHVVSYGIIQGLHLIEMFAQLATLGGPDPKANWLAATFTNLISLGLSFTLSYMFVFNKANIKSDVIEN